MVRILVVDDEPKIRAMITAILEPEGFEVISAESGEEALQRIAQSPPHLLISDMKLTGMSGLELLRQARATHPQMLAFLLTGFDDDEVERQATALGALGVIRKPLVLSQLRQTIKDALAKLPTT